MLESPGLTSVCCLALAVAGCPKRQTAPRVVYVPAPPPAAQPSGDSPGVTVIEEPAPPEPAEAQPKEAAATKPAPPRHDAPAKPEPAAETAAPPPADVPPLAPRESPQQQNNLRQQVEGLQGDLRARIAKLEGTRLGVTERRTLVGARGFLAQSQRALDEGDLQRALNLARKASLLLQALEQTP